jgi:hypothetical protein
MVPGRYLPSDGGVVAIRCALDHLQVMIRYLLPLTLVGGALAASCSDVKSCSAEAGKNADPCCTPSPAGLFIFRQRFEPDVGGDMGSWGIDGMEVLEYVSLHIVSHYVERETNM